VEASPRTVAQAAEGIAEVSRGTVAQVVVAEDIAEALPRTAARVAVGLPLEELVLAEVILAELPLAEQPMARPVHLLPGPSARLRISHRSVRCFPSARHNCCRMPYSFPLLKPDSSHSFRVRPADAQASEPQQIRIDRRLHLDQLQSAHRRRNKFTHRLAEAPSSIMRIPDLETRTSTICHVIDLPPAPPR
jgi:hypothetical protein